jgi:hypothetical protein
MGVFLTDNLGNALLSDDTSSGGVYLNQQIVDNSGEPISDATVIIEVSYDCWGAYLYG